MTSSTSAPALTPHPFDLDAFGELAAFADSAGKAFDLNAIDRGFERLIARPTRNKAGKTLAGRLVRDARKYLKAKRSREVLSDSIEPDDSRSALPSDMEQEDIRWAIRVIHDGLMSLHPRDRLALAAKANAGNADDMAVKPRQFRNLVTNARAHLWQQPGIEIACQILLDGINRWRFETIELMFPLVNCLAT